MGTIIKAVIDGEERELEILAGPEVQTKAGVPTHTINHLGEIILETSANLYQSRWYLRLIGPLHTFGGVVYEEVATRRYVIAGEWYLNTDEKAIHHCNIPLKESYGSSEFIILRPVSIEVPDGN